MTTRTEMLKHSIQIRWKLPSRLPQLELTGWREGAVLIWILLLLMICLSDRPASAQSGPPAEYQVKAAFLFHFAQFVDWPDEAFPEKTSPLTYCTVGGDPFHGWLDKSLSGKSVGTRPMRVEHFPQMQEAQGCQVMFISSPKKPVPELLSALNGTPVLTVGDSEQFAEQGGMVGFLLEEKKVRFVINVAAAERAKLKISARLLALAKTVIGGPERR